MNCAESLAAGTAGLSRTAHMSDAPQGHGWWQATDGKWYPPESHPNYRPTIPQPTMPTLTPPVLSYSQFTPPALPPTRKRKKPLWKRTWVVASFLLIAAVAAITIASPKDDETQASTALASADNVGATDAPAATVSQDAPADTPAPAPAPASNLTPSQENAVRSAESYLDLMGFSRQGLIGQLEFEQYSTDDATVAVDSLFVDWNAEAAQSAASYLETMAFSCGSLIDQLEFEGFTPDQATFGAAQTGIC